MSSTSLGSLNVIEANGVASCCLLVPLAGDAVSRASLRRVGPFRADILCKDRANGDWVLIENQLESTDHTHLGQLMTYAAGLIAVKIVWIARRFTDEHRAALDWLNEITDSRFNFFGREVELWRIQDSPVAPRFNVVCKPNDWSRNVADAARSIESGQSSETEQQYLKFWTQFAERVDARGNPIRAPKPYGGYLRSFSVGKAYFYIFALAPMRDKWIGIPTASPYIPGRASAHGSNDFWPSTIRGNGSRGPYPGLLSALCSPLGNETANDESELTGAVSFAGK